MVLVHRSRASLSRRFRCRGYCGREGEVWKERAGRRITLGWIIGGGVVAELVSAASAADNKRVIVNVKKARKGEESVMYEACYVTVRDVQTGKVVGAVRSLWHGEDETSVEVPLDFSEVNVGEREMIERRLVLISSRLDEDGLAATRGEFDLVGRAQIELNINSQDDAEPATVDLVLRGRGLAGRLLTKKA